MSSQSKCIGGHCPYCAQVKEFIGNQHTSFQPFENGEIGDRGERDASHKAPRYLKGLA